MRELNAGTHKVRRSSFSNTLTLLPEVEEPYPDIVSPISVVPGESKSLSSSGKLPPIIDVASLAMEAGCDVHPVPTSSKTAIHYGKPSIRRSLSCEPTVAKVGSMEITNLHQKGPRNEGYQKNITQLFSKSHSGPHHHVSERRWSIGSPISRVSRESHRSDRRHSKEHVDKRTPMDSHSTPVTKATNSNNSTFTIILNDNNNNNSNSRPMHAPKQEDLTSSWHALPSPRKFSDSSLVIEKKDRLEIMNDPMLTRRWSNPTYAETTKKVNLLLKAGQNMRSKLNQLEGKTDQSRIIRTLADLAVEMPTNPRFSALLSPEAQYSIMMGYEDKIYDRLVNQHPEYQQVLRRSKTPVEKVQIRRKDSVTFVGDESDDDDDDNDDNEFDDDDEDNDEEVSEQNCSTRSSFLTQLTENTNSSFHSFNGPNFFGSKNQQHRGSTQSLESSTSDFPERPDSRNTLRSLRRLSVSLEKKHYLNKLFDKINGDDLDTDGTYLNLHRSCSLPNVSSLPFSRRLMMTHRLESAMDILDSMKGQGEVSISPRLKARKSLPFADYSSWIHEWNKEFRVKQATSPLNRKLNVS